MHVIALPGLIVRDMLTVAPESKLIGIGRFGQGTNCDVGSNRQQRDKNTCITTLRY